MTDLRIDTDVPMTTRDGVRLVADVYRPDDGVRYPALLHRTPYDKANPSLTSVLVADPVALARAGYAVVMQDVRGRFGSEGTMDFARQEYADGYDAVEWAAAQPWCDGQVGIYGSSYHAIAGYAALAARPPHLRAALVMIGAADLATTVRPGGLFELGFMTYYSLGQAVGSIQRSDRSDTQKAAAMQRVLGSAGDLSTAVRHLPVSAIPGLDDPQFAPAWHEWMTDELGEYAAAALSRQDVLPDIPLLSVIGFQDFMQRSMMTAYGLREPGERHRLVAGPWAHNGTYTGQVGSRSYVATAGGGVATWQQVIQGWFDRWFKDGLDRVTLPTARAMLSGEPVRYFVTGENVWRSSPDWPPSSTDQTWYLSEDGRLQAEAADGPARTYVHDPLDPVPTRGGMFTAPMLGPDGIQDQTARQARDDVLVWTSDVLSEAVTTAGSAHLVAHLASTAEDTDVVVILSDVEPGGFVANVAEGALRTRYRSGTTDHWLVPEEPTELIVELHAASHTFAAGHRIRVDIAGSSFPRFSRNLGTRVIPELGNASDARASTQTVWQDTARPSRVTLPVVTRGQ